MACHRCLVQGHLAALCPAPAPVPRSETVSFEEMLEQARSQSDRYSDVEDSEDEDFEPYVIHYKDYQVGYEVSHTSVATA